MSVNVRTGLFLCHVPGCGARGNVFQFFQRVRNLTREQAEEELARRAGVSYRLDARGRGPRATVEDQRAP